MPAADARGKRFRYEPDGGEVRRRRERAALTQVRLAELADCSPRTVRRIEHGTPVDGATLQGVARALSVPDWRELLSGTEKARLGLQDATASSAGSGPADAGVVDAEDGLGRHIVPFAKALAEPEGGFVGRGFVFEEFDRFRGDVPSGYFVIEAEPGAGKSAFLAAFARRTGCIHFFNNRSLSVNRADQFLGHVCASLISRYRLFPARLPPSGTADGAALADLLFQVRRQAGDGGTVVIAIDALDEVERTPRPPTRTSSTSRTSRPTGCTSS